MAVSDLVYALPEELYRTAEVVLWILGAVGIFIILFIVFEIVTKLFGKTQKDELRKINENLQDIKLLLKNK